MFSDLGNFIAVAATALAFAFCGWFIAGDAGAIVSALLSLAIFLRPARSRSLLGRDRGRLLQPATRQSYPNHTDLA